MFSLNIANIVNESIAFVIHVIITAIMIKYCRYRYHCCTLYCVIHSIFSPSCHLLILSSLLALLHLHNFCAILGGCYGSCTDADTATLRSIATAATRLASGTTFDHHAINIAKIALYTITSSINTISSTMVFL